MPPCEHGTCTDNNDCICNSGYVNSYPFFVSGSRCDHKQKDPLTAFLLALFIGWISGAEYFYLEIIPLAIVQLCIFWFGFVCCMKYYSKPLVVIWLIIVIGWWIMSCVKIAKGQYDDGNGYPVPPL